MSNKEIHKSRESWIVRNHIVLAASDNFKEITKRLQLTANDNDNWICGGRISDEHPLYLPEHHQLTRLNIEVCHKETKHG